MAVVTDEEIVPAIVVVVADTAALTPAAVCKASFGCDVGEGTVPIVLEEMRDGFLALRKSLDTGAVDEENVDPVVMIVVEESYSAACGFEEISVFAFTTVDGFGVKPDWRATSMKLMPREVPATGDGGPLGARRGLAS